MLTGINGANVRKGRLNGTQYRQFGWKSKICGDRWFCVHRVAANPSESNSHIRLYDGRPCEQPQLPADR